MIEGVDLSPAKWIWLPSERTLPNIFVLFRREVELKEKPKRAKGWITADSRYRLIVNGQRVQLGPAPSDPRHLEVDPVDLVPFLKPGENVIGVEVLFYGHGEGTWPCGKPGLIVSLDIDGQKIVSDKSWMCAVDRGHRPGQPKRSYLRALQEEFDCRQWPWLWNTADYELTPEWVGAAELDVPATRSPIAGSYSEYVNEIWMAYPEASTLSPRSIPLMHEEWLPRDQVEEVEYSRIEWRRDPCDWFDFRMPESFNVSRRTAKLPANLAAIDMGTGSFLGPKYQVEVGQRNGALLTFRLPKEVIGWPLVEVFAPGGTTIEVIVQESAVLDEHALLDTARFSWSRLIMPGESEDDQKFFPFQPFDYEAVRWVQVHVWHPTKTVGAVIGKPRMLVRRNAWPHEAQVKTSDPVLKKVFDAALNTLDNCAQDICVDGMGRERQQYSGDCSHQLHALRPVHGSTDVSKRFLKTFAYGQNLEGYWFDSWPAFDRMDRLWQRQLGLSEWGPLLDHSVGFCFDHYHHWMQTGDLETVREHWPRLMRFVDYLLKQMTGDPKGLMPVKDIGVPAVWMDHLAYENQDQKRLAYNLYAAAMLREAMLPMALALGKEQDAEQVGDMGTALVSTCARHYWDSSFSLFVNNKGTGQPPRCDDRSLATAVLYDLCPNGQTGAAVALLANLPLREEEFAVPDLGTLSSGRQARTPLNPPPRGEKPSVGFSYPANAVWRYWALAKAGRIDVVLKEFREKWATMYSVQHNGTFQEFWDEKPGGQGLMSHCAVSPLILLHQGLLGLRPLAPGYKKLDIRPQLADIPALETTAYIPQGAIHFNSQLDNGRHRGTVLVPAGVEAILTLPDEQQQIPSGKPFEFEMA